MNLFDSLQIQANSIVNTTFGYDAVWNPLDESAPVAGRVLLNKPTQRHNVTDEEYDAISPKMEYFEGEFPGLLQRVRENSSEPITIDGVVFYTLRAELKFDGKSIIVYLSEPA